ncbi:putative uncharacterized transposon-derived protein F54H12.3 [Trichonephila clavipes]|nr:putative uncharacterized transposon-derived protein F54H12.3 [Trichonephila clavipes]
MNELKRKTGLSQKEISDFLHQQDVYTKHKPLIRKFKRRRIYVSHIDDQWQADLLFVYKFAKNKYNEGTKYLLTVIDCFSKYAWAIPIKDKSSNEVTQAFKKVFKERIPEKIQTDKGLEFVGQTTQKLFRENNIQWFTTENVEIKAAMVERFNLTLGNKIKLYLSENNTEKYIDVLDKLVQNYNNSKHNSIKMTPVEASLKENSDKVYRNLYKEKVIHKPKFQVGDKVRISIHKSTFRRGYQATFTEEIFVISEVLKTDPITYRIKDLNNEEVKGTFYENELVKYGKKDSIYKIEKIIKKKGDKYLVKWLGYPESTWIDKKDFVL